MGSFKQENERKKKQNEKDIYKFSTISNEIELMKIQM